MALYAIVNSGIVADLVSTPDGVNINSLNFLTPTQIANAVLVPSNVTPYVNWTYSNGTFSPPAASAPTLVQQAQAALAAGLQITSSGTPSLNATYANDVVKIMAIATYIIHNNSFPASLSTLPWPDINGIVHIFPSTSEFMAFATAIANYVILLDIIINTNSGSLPSNTATIS